MGTSFPCDMTRRCMGDAHRIESEPPKGQTENSGETAPERASVSALSGPGSAAEPPEQRAFAGKPTGNASDSRLNGG